jgi:cytosine/adenosine deaminase-related metal-dependent hydrolase
MRAQQQPVRDPIRTLVWYASSADVDTVIIGERVVVHAGKVLGLDEAGTSHLRPSRQQRIDRAKK